MTWLNIFLPADIYLFFRFLAWTKTKLRHYLKVNGISSETKRVIDIKDLSFPTTSVAPFLHSHLPKAQLYSCLYQLKYYKTSIAGLNSFFELLQVSSAPRQPRVCPAGCCCCCFLIRNLTIISHSPGEHHGALLTDVLEVYTSWSEVYATCLCSPGWHGSPAGACPLISFWSPPQTPSHATHTSWSIC